MNETVKDNIFAMMMTIQYFTLTVVFLCFVAAAPETKIEQDKCQADHDTDENNAAVCISKNDDTTTTTPTPTLNEPVNNTSKDTASSSYSMPEQCGVVLVKDHGKAGWGVFVAQTLQRGKTLLGRDGVVQVHDLPPQRPQQHPSMALLLKSYLWEASETGKEELTQANVQLRSSNKTVNLLRDQLEQARSELKDKNKASKWNNRTEGGL